MDKINGSAAAAATVVDNCLDLLERRLVNRHGFVLCRIAPHSQQSTQTWLWFITSAGWYFHPAYRPTRLCAIFLTEQNKPKNPTSLLSSKVIGRFIFSQGWLVVVAVQPLTTVAEGPARTYGGASGFT